MNSHSGKNAKINSFIIMIDNVSEEKELFYLQKCYNKIEYSVVNH